MTKLGASLVAISPQTMEKNEEVRANHRLSFPVLSDPGNAYAETLGLSFALPDELRQVYGGFGIDLPGSNGDDSWTLPLPTRIVVDSKGIIVRIDADPDYTKRPEPDTAIEALSELTNK